MSLRTTDPFLFRMTWSETLSHFCSTTMDATKLSSWGFGVVAVWWPLICWRFISIPVLPCFLAALCIFIKFLRISRSNMEYDHWTFQDPKIEVLYKKHHGVYPVDGHWCRIFKVALNWASRLIAPIATTGTSQKNSRHLRIVRLSISTFEYLEHSRKHIR